MSAIDTNMLAAMRSAIAELLPDTCNILTLTNTPDGMGGVTQSWGTAYSGISCRLDDKTASMPVVGGAVQNFAGMMLSVPYNTTINEVDRVEIGGATYAVSNVNTGQSWMAVKRVMLESVG